MTPHEIISLAVWCFALVISAYAIAATIRPYRTRMWGALAGRPQPIVENVT